MCFFSSSTSNLKTAAFKSLSVVSFCRCLATKGKDGCSPKELMSLENKVGLITGGTEGVGLTAANHILRNGGKGVAITGIDTNKGKEAVNCLNNAYGRNKAMFINANSNCLVQLEETFKVVKDAFDGIDIVVNNAAICDGKKWENEIVTNVIGKIRGTLLGYKYMGKQCQGKGGVIINMSSVSGLGILSPAPTLCCCDHAIVGLSRSFGHGSHYNRTGVRVLSLCLGFTGTKFFKDPVGQAMTEEMGHEFKSVLKNSKHQIADVAGKGVVHLIKHGESGSVWVLESARLFLCNIPRYDQYSSLQAQFL